MVHRHSNRLERFSTSPCGSSATREVGGGGFDGLRGRKIAIGPGAQRTQALSLELLKRHGIKQQVSEIAAAHDPRSADRLLAGDIDAAFMVASWTPPGRPAAPRRKSTSSCRATLKRMPMWRSIHFSTRCCAQGRERSGGRSAAAGRGPDRPKAALVVRRDLHPAIQVTPLERRPRRSIPDRESFSASASFLLQKALGFH